MLMYPSNFLLLDEPTNHLDLRAKDVLLEALEKFTGTVVFVSHDRYFIDKLATKVFEVAEQTVTVFPGNYEDFRWRKEHVAVEVETEEAGSGANAVQQSQADGTGEAGVNGSRPGANALQQNGRKRLNPIKLRQMQDRQRELEEQISRVEAEIGECESGLQRYVSAEETARLASLLEKRRSELQALLGEWEELSATIEGNA